jgi:hypothetical protein
VFVNFGFTRDGGGATIPRPAIEALRAKATLDRVPSFLVLLNHSLAAGHADVYGALLATFGPVVRHRSSAAVCAESQRECAGISPARKGRHVRLTFEKGETEPQRSPWMLHRCAPESAPYFQNKF